jgi:hypothetical protein
MSFFDNLFGSAQEDTLRQADAEAKRSLNKGFKQQNQRYDEAYGLYQPYAEQGREANDFYYNALGLGTPEQQTTALNTLTSNPLFQGQLGQESNALARSLNARGASGGGQAQLAAQRVFQQNAGNWLNRYRDLGGQGLQVTGQQAGIRTAQGDNAYGHFGNQAGRAINTGNAMAQMQTNSANNLMNAFTGLASTAIGGFTPGAGGVSAFGNMFGARR